MTRLGQTLLTFLILALAQGWAGPALASPAPKVDRVVVKKSIRTLYLYRGNKVVRSFPVSLGKNPRGHKVRRGDRRTPEGRYVLDWRNEQSRFYRAIHISYPNQDDLRRAQQLGVQAGGAIMIHGLPNRYGDDEDYFLSRDWTEGCIAVGNRDMDEIWRLVADQTVIEIHP
ncbi:lipoprotein [Desulfuromonas versatilis]|uniref:Lipoprotein n=1 Tax=Desulfuromonas versatilis TaxID=2802975 RepID=A0ABN6E2I3_9BACT|nr:L,D-transpeptidase family protein [Desulfuromonas versatilis]BCR06552.1 lipoprotein [Desulfuromonas versatilis]